jgi:hypothetical protein
MASVCSVARIPADALQGMLTDIRAGSATMSAAEPNRLFFGDNLAILEEQCLTKQ